MNMLAICDFAGMDEAAVKAKICEDFEIDNSVLTDVEIVVAYMSVGSWGCDSDAFIVIRRDNKLFEIHGSHCSCYGFEGQWDEEPLPDVSVIATRDDYELAGGGYDNDSVNNAAAIRAALSKVTAS